MSLEYHSTHFVPNAPGSRPSDDVVRLFPEIKHAESGVFHHAGTALPYYISRAAEESVLVPGCTGLNSYGVLKSNHIKRMNDHGISVIWMALPPSKKNHGFMDDYILNAEGFFTEAKSPVNALFDSGLPRHAFTHSTGSQIFQTLQHRDETGEKLAEAFRSVSHKAPFYDAANASLNHSSPLNRWAFEWYGDKHLEEKPHETMLGNAYLKLRALREPFMAACAVISPTYSQIREVQQFGRTLLDSFVAAKAEAVPTTYIIGNEDPFACAKTSLAVAQGMNCGLEIVKAGHDPLEDRMDIIDSFIHYATGKMPEDHESALSYGSRLALQSGARLLNPAAGFFKSLLGGGVGNAEMRGQTERNALYGGNALRL